MVKQISLAVEGKFAQGIEVSLPAANLVVVIGAKGYIMCGYLNLETAEKLDQAACIVRGVKSVDELLKARIAAVSSRAKSLGVKEGQACQEALKILA